MSIRGWTQTTAVLATIATTAVLGACGGDDAEDPGSPTPSSEPASLVPQNPFGVTEVDLAAARETLGLPADADPAADGSAAQSRFAATARAALPFYLPHPRGPLPVAKAIDGSRIEVAAAPSFTGASSVIVLRTGQPFAEIAASLERDGYRRAGRILNYPGDPNDVNWPEVVRDADDEALIAVAGERTAAFAALGEPAAAERPDLELLGELPAAPARSVEVGAAGGSCVSAIGLADLIADDRGELVLEIEGGADPERFELNPRAAALFELGEPEAGDSLLRVPFTFTDEARREGGLAAFDWVGFTAPYRC